MKNKDTSQSMPDNQKEAALHYFKTLVDVARESFLILNSDLRVLSANPTFYENFQVTLMETEGKLFYDLGNGQWDIAQLRTLLEEILPEKKVVRNYEVEHIFEKIGQKTMQLNARQIDTVQLIILAIEDITDKKKLEKKLSEYTEGLEVKVTERTQELAGKITELEALNKTMVGRELKMIELKEEIKNLEKLVKNGNGNHKKGNGHKK
jgi:hypothetical protein